MERRDRGGAELLTPSKLTSGKDGVVGYQRSSLLLSNSIPEWFNICHCRYKNVGTSRMGLSSTIKLPAAWRRRCSGGPANDERWQTKCGKGRQIRGSRHVPARLGYQGFRCFCFLRLLPLNSNSRTTHHFVYLP